MLPPQRLLFMSIKLIVSGNTAFENSESIQTLTMKYWINIFHNLIHLNNMNSPVQNTVSALVVLTVVGTVSAAPVSVAQLQQPAAAAAAASVQLQLHLSATVAVGDVSDAVSVIAAVPSAAVDLLVPVELEKKQMHITYFQ